MERSLSLTSLKIHKSTKLITLTTIQNFTWSLLVFLSLSLPVYIQKVKIVLLAVLLVISLIKIFLHQCKFSLSMVRLGLIWLAFAVPVFLIGFIRGNVGAMAFFKIQIFYPVLLFVCVATIRNRKCLDWTVKAIFCSALFISLYTFAFLLYSLGKWPLPFFWIIDDISGASIHSGYSHITTTHLSMMMFIFPLLCGLSKKERIKLKIKPFFFYLTILLSFIAIFLSGRRILWIAAAVGILILIIRLEVSLRKKLLFIGILMAVGIVLFFVLVSRFNLSLEGLVDRFKEAFSEYDEYGQENVRYIQMAKLLEGFKNNLWIGAGGGATIKGYLRNEASPWIFEASYHTILFNGGIIFSTFYVIFFIYFLRLIFKNCRKTLYAIPILLALVCVLIGNSTNPYFSGSFDFLILLFVPLLFVINKRQYYPCIYIKKGPHLIALYDKFVRV